VAVPLLVLLIRRVGAAPVIALMYLGGALWTIGWQHIQSTADNLLFADMAKQLPGQAGYFAAGVAGALWLRTRTLPGFPVLAVGVVLFVLPWPVPYVMLGPIAIGLIVLGMGYGPYLGNFGRYGDFSYGIYIVHYPIIQTMIAYRLLTDRPGLFVSAAFAVSLIASIALWHLLEKHFLRSTSHYRRSEGDSSPESPADECSNAPGPAPIS
jgi:peptidoglycan/LPS O-acetylase OafA/YrhL